jgi:hypothetical protein
LVHPAGRDVNEHRAYLIGRREGVEVAVDGLERLLEGFGIRLRAEGDDCEKDGPVGVERRL